VIETKLYIYIERDVEEKGYKMERESPRAS